MKNMYDSGDDDMKRMMNKVSQDFIIPFYSILFHFIPFYSILFHFIPFYSIIYIYIYI